MNVRTAQTRPWALGCDASLTGSPRQLVASVAKIKRKAHQKRYGGCPGVREDRPTPFIEAADGAQLDKDGVIAHCAAKIAGYKKPKYVTFVDALPRNNSGKVNKGQLRAAHQAAEGEHDG